GVGRVAGLVLGTAYQGLRHTDFTGPTDDRVGPGCAPALVRLTMEHLNVELPYSKQRSSSASTCRWERGGVAFCRRGSEEWDEDGFQWNRNMVRLQFEPTSQKGHEGCAVA